MQGRLNRVRSWSRAGHRVDYQHQASIADLCISRAPLHQSRFESILNASTVSLHDKVQRALELEEMQTTDPDPTSPPNPSFYFRTQSRKDAQRKKSDGPDIGRYCPNFNAIWHRNPAFQFSKEAFERSIGGTSKIRIRRRHVLKPIRNN